MQGMGEHGQQQRPLRKRYSGLYCRKDTRPWAFDILAQHNTLHTVDDMETSIILP